jgi:GTPase SAR1 family protein
VAIINRDKGECDCMTEIFIKYNPYKVETSIILDDIDLTESGSLSHFKNERFQVWIEQLIPILSNEIINDTDFTIIFQGTTPDYEDLEEICHFFNESQGMEITLEHVKAKETEDKITELTRLVQHMQQGPFEALRDEKIQQNFDKAINSEFEIGVIATMSSGKSTLINALLGKELMPSKNEACTATIAQIKNTDGFEGFIASCYNRNDIEIIPEQFITAEHMAEFNENAEVSLIKMEGDIPNIYSHKMNLVLVDTPGPNNSMNQAHRDHTYRVIKNDSKPMILYVLNGTQLHTDDDDALLSTVAEQMRVGGKQSKDRFIFAVNKVDCFDPEKGENVGNILSNVEMYLRDHGITNPNIYPVSAELAKVIRMYQNGLKLTRTQRKTLENYDLFTEEPSMHLNQYQPLSPSIKKQLQVKIEEAKSAQDYYSEALYHSGVPAIEAAINEYLEKYAVTSKVSNAISSFQKIIEDQQMLQNLMEELDRDHEERRKMYEQMKRIEKELENGKKAKALETKILNLDIDVTKDIKSVQGKIQKELAAISTEFNNAKFTRNDANIKISKSRKKVESLQSDVLTDLEKIVQNFITSNAERLVAEYKSYVAEIVDITGIDNVKFDRVQLLTSSLPNADDIISKHTYSEREVVGTRTVENTNKKWYKPWTYKQSKYYEEDVYGNVEYVDGVKLRDEFVAPIHRALEDNIYRAIDHLEHEKHDLQSLFVNELKLLNEKLLEKVKEIKDLSQEADSLSHQIEVNKEKKQWLDALVIRLENILEI